MQPCLHLLAEYCIHFVDKEGEGDIKSQHFMDVMYGSPLKEYVWRDGVGTWKLGGPDFESVDKDRYHFSMNPQ